MQERCAFIGDLRKKLGSLLPKDFALQPVEEVLILARSVSEGQKTLAGRSLAYASG